MRLHLVNDLSSSEAIAPGTAALVFDRPAFDRLVERGVESYFVDDLLDWTERAAIEESVADVLARLEAEKELAACRIEGYPLLGVARNDLRVDVTNVLRTAAAVGRLPAPLAFDEITDLGCPAGVAPGAAAATTATVAPPASPSRLRRPAGVTMANALLLARSHLRAKNTIRVLAFPGGKLLTALQETDARILRELRLGVAAFPGLVAGGAARLATHGLPAVVATARRNRPGAPNLLTSLPRLADEPKTDVALRTVVKAVLSRVADVAAGSAHALEQIDAGGLRAIVLPTTSGSSAAIVAEWARSHGLRRAVVQHGIYGFRDWDNGDRDADVVLAWGPGVRDQLLGPQVSPIGTPGISQLPERVSKTGACRILVATTNAPLGSALGRHGFCEDFIDALRPALGLLSLQHQIVVRPHPSEQRARYEQMLGGLASRICFSSGSFADDVAGADVVVSSFSSAAFEAAAMGRPVALWLGGVPLEIRRRFLLPPFDRDLPAGFVDREGFMRLADSLATWSSPALDEMAGLSKILRRFATPFHPDRFAAELAALGS